MLFSDLIYDFLVMLSKRLTETDVSIILALLQCKCSVIFQFHVFGVCLVLVRASTYVNSRGLKRSYLVILISNRLLDHCIL